MIEYIQKNDFYIIFCILLQYFYIAKKSFRIGKFKLRLSIVPETLLRWNRRLFWHLYLYIRQHSSNFYSIFKHIEQFSLR